MSNPEKTTAQEIKDKISNNINDFIHRIKEKSYETGNPLIRVTRSSIIGFFANNDAKTFTEHEDDIKNHLASILQKDYSVVLGQQGSDYTFDLPFKIILRETPKDLVELKPPTNFNIDYIKPKIYDDILAAIVSGAKCFIVGPPGCGKSILPEHVAKTLNRHSMRRSLSKISDPKQLIGSFHIKEKNGVSVTEHVDGIITECAKKGIILILDECDQLSPQAATALNTVTEANGKIVISTENNTEVITPHENFVMVFTSNTWGRGDESGGLFAGAERQNVAFLSRLGPKFYMDYDDDLEQILLEPHLPKAVMNAFYKSGVIANQEGIVTQIRKRCRTDIGASDAAIQDFLGMRTLLRVAQFYSYYGWHKCMLYCFVHDFDPTFHKDISQVIVNIMGEEFRPSNDESFIKQHAQTIKNKGF